MHINTTPKLEFAEIDEKFNHRNSMNTKGFIHPALKKNSHFFVIYDAFTHFVVTKPTALIDAKTAADVLLKQGIIVFGPPNLLVTYKGEEVFKTIIANMCVFLALIVVPIS